MASKKSTIVGLAESVRSDIDRWHELGIMIAQAIATGEGDSDSLATEQMICTGSLLAHAGMLADMLFPVAQEE